MSPLSTILILFVTLFIASRLWMLLTRKQKIRKEKLFLKLSKEGSANNLVFCSQEILHDKVMGIDGIHRKVMILEKMKHTYKSCILSLDEMQSCELKSSYAKNSTFKKSIDKIELQFGFKNSPNPASIIFYDGLVNSKKEIVLLKAKAEYWSVMLSKMLLRQVEASA